MFEVKTVNKLDATDILIDRTYENEEEATKYYNLVKDNMIADKNKIIREADEELKKSELRNSDIKLTLSEDGKVKSKFML